MFYSVFPDFPCRSSIQLSQQWSEPIRLAAEWRQYWSALCRRALLTGLLGPTAHRPADHQGDKGKPLLIKHATSEFFPKLSPFPQIIRTHYQNALTATRMDSSPQTPDPVDADAKGRQSVVEARSHSIALPLTSAHTRLGLARLAQLHPHAGFRNTCRLNERNRIVRK